MKKIYISFLTLVVCITNIFAQTPEKLNYQAIVRNSSNVILTNTNIGMQISILEGSNSGTVVYAETQTPTTNVNGLVTIEIGTGTVVSGTFNTIDWSNDIYFIKTEIDPTGGNSYTITGTSQLMSVPYALHAKTAESISGGITENDPVFTASAAKSISNSDITNWNNKLSTEVDGSTTNEIELPTNAENGDMSYYNGTSWVKIKAPSNNNMVLTFCQGKPIWTTNGECPVIVGSLTEGGIVYKIFQSGDSGYIEGETHGMVASSTQGASLYNLSGNYISTLNTGTYNNWRLPTYDEIGEVSSAVGGQGFFTSDFHWSSSSSGTQTQWVANPEASSGSSQGWGNTYSVFAIRDF